MIDVVLTDDHLIVRRGLAQILSDERDIRIVGEAASASEALALLSRVRCDVLVLDLNMPGRSGLELLGELGVGPARPRVLILSMHPEDQLARRALKAGADGYLTKDTAPDELVKAIRKVHGGGKYVSEALAEQLVFGLGADREAPPHELLSEREYAVLCLLGEGKTITEIADQLLLSVKTVSTYRSRMLEKMRLRTTADLVRYAVVNDLAPEPALR